MNESVSGLGALGFWIFLGMLALAVAWAIVRIMQIRHETLIRIVERGQTLGLGSHMLPIHHPHGP